MAGRHSEKESIQIPFDILKYLAERYHLETGDMMKPFVKGLLIGLDEKDNGKESDPGYPRASKNGNQPVKK